jgi:hypothetical protein
MLVQCITNNFRELPDLSVRNRLAESIHIEGGDEDLVVGKNYEVFALEQWSDGGIRVVEDSDYPYPFPLEMFSVVDPAFPVDWSVAFEKRSLGLVVKRISYSEWCSDDRYYEKLVDGDEDAIANYRAHRSAR